METFRLYTAPDGQSHIEPIDLARTPEWTGKGHTTRTLGNDPCVTATIPLA